MDRNRRLSLSVGAFVLVALAAFAVTILSLSARQGFFRARYHLVGFYDNVQGLLPGAAVRLAGTRVGQVKSVELSERPDGKPAIRVELQIDRDVQDRITSDSLARIGTIGLLGDQIVEISIGALGSPPLADGAQIATVEPFDLSQVVSRAPAVLDSVQAIQASAGTALAAIESLARNLDESVQDFQAERGAKRLAESFRGLNDIVAEIQKGDGALHALVYEPYEGSALADMDRAVASFANVMETVEKGDGFLHSLVYEKATDEDVLFQILQAAARLNSILDKIDRGEGTLGLLLNDPTLYEELKLLVGGAGRSTIVRTLIDLVTRGDDPGSGSQ